eukprot:352637_1
MRIMDPLPYGETIESIKIFPKFKCFKEELLQNPYVTLNIDQYNNEYRKAQIYFQSKYCKTEQQFKTYTKESDDYGCYHNIEWIFKLEYIFAMMIYTNYTALQYEFSKTYRSNKAKYHNHFYFWGQYLKICIHQFGMKTSKTIGGFYHGITRKLYFPHYINSDGLDGVNIWCPLSTTKSFEVAFNFAAKNGLVIELSDHHSSFNDRFGSLTKGLSLSW